MARPVARNPASSVTTEKFAISRELVKDIDGAMLASGGLAKIKKANLKRDEARPPASPRLGPCIGNVKNFIAIGLNYSDHAAEAGMPIQKEPIIFNKVHELHQPADGGTITPRRVRQARLRG